MAEKKASETNAMHQIPQQGNNAMVLRIPKPNMQVAVLGIVAFITLFQTFQLVRISGASNSTSVKALPAATTTSTHSSGTGSNADVPESMVGGC